MIATEIQTEIYNFLSETRGVQTADLSMLDSLCCLYFENVQEHLLSLVPISEFKTEWILENEEFRKNVSRSCRSKISAKSGSLMMMEKRFSRSVLRMRRK